MRHVGKVPEKRGDVSIWGLWEIQIEVIIDARFVDDDVDNCWIGEKKQ